MLSVLLLLTLGADPAPARAATWLPFPGQGPAFMDYLAYDAAHGALWLPAGNRGQVFVLDVATRAFRAVPGFATKSVRDRTAGPSSATVGEGVVFVGNRGDDSVCAVDAVSLKKRGCVTLPSMPDGLAYVAATHEVWVTAPGSQQLLVINAAKPDALALAKTIDVQGEPEGYAVDEEAEVFYTNLEDRDRTLIYDVTNRTLQALFTPECGKGGPRGMALDAEHHRLFIACSDGARTMDLAQHGVVAGRLTTGGGVDNIDYDRASHRLLIASGKDAKLVIAQVDDAGGLKVVESIPTAEGSRCVVTAKGAAYVPDSRGGRLLVVSPSK